MPIRKTKTQKGYIRYRAELCVKGKRASKSFETMVDAALWHDKQEKLMRDGISFDDNVTHGDMLFHEAADRAIIERRKAVSAAQTKSNEFSAMQLVTSFGKKKKMSEITPQDVSLHVLKRMTENNVGPSSIRAELSFLRTVYTKAIEWGVSYPSPDLNIKRPKAKMRQREERLDQVIKPYEITSLLTEAKKRKNNLYNYLLFLLYTGMRPGEAAHLYWERLPAKEEKEANKNFLPVGYIDLNRGGFSKIGTKTGQRFVPGHPEAIKIIEYLKKHRGKDQKLVFLENKFLNVDRAYRYYRRTMRTTVSNAVIGERKLRRDITFYSCRHTARSRMEECGISTAIAETIIGHQDKGFKFTYIHLSDEVLVDEIKKLYFEGIV